MKIHSISLEHYGQYEFFHLSAEQLAAPITIIYGPNEAGKSTLHSFIRAMLFGFRSKYATQQSFVHPHTYGQLILQDETQDLIQIERKIPPKNGKVTVYQGQQKEEGEAAVKKWLGGISAPLYTNIFCFGYQELQQLETLQGDEVAAYLHSAAIGAGGINLLEIERKMGRAQEQLFKPKATNPELNQLLIQLEKDQQEIIDLQRKLDQYKPLQQELVRAEEEQLQLRNKRLQLEKERSFYEATLHVYDLRQKQKEAEALLSELQLKPFLLLPLEGQIQQLYRQEAVIQDKTHEVIRLKEELQQLDAQLQHHVHRLGNSWTLEQVMAVDVSIPQKERIVQAARNLEQMEARLSSLKEKWSEKLLAAQRAEQRWQGLQQQLEEKLAQQKLWKQETGRNARDVRQEQSERLWLWSSLGGVGLAAFMWVRGQALEGAVVLGTAIMLAFGLYSWSKRQQKQKFEWQKRILQLEQHGSPESYMISGAKQEAEDILREVQDYEVQIHSAEIELKEATKQGVEIFDQQELPFPLQLHSLHALLQTIEQIQKDHVYQQRLRKKKEILEQEIHLWHKEVQELYEKYNARRSLNLVAGQSSVEESSVEESIIEQHDYHSGQVQGSVEPLIKQMNLEHERARRIQEQQYLVTQLSAELKTLIEQLPLDAQTLEELFDRSVRVEHEDAIAQLGERYQQLVEQIEKQAQHVGYLKQELAQIENQDTLTLLQVEFEEKKALFREKAKSWAAFAVARSLCQQTRRIYEEERQPTLLRQASYFFSMITQQRYKQVIAPIGEDELVVIDQQGKRWNSAQLSQGTKEQLYLAMRFALIKEYEQQVTLPIIMDDPFVHFDQIRLKEVLLGLQELAATHQVILFTCHDHYLQFVQEIGLQANIISLETRLVE